MQVGGGAGAEQPLRLAGGGVGADDDDRDRGGGGVVAQALQHLVAVDVGQVQVEQDERRAVLAGQLEAEAALHGRDDLDVRPLREDPLDEA